ncbi:zinc ribbon domain-containing protein [Neobacillus mesonae]|uniref:zinc ribbon domain-containing protein n=1 Tax=Neobacillus mesonae TaxID=1193713 RepID=UPI002E1B4AB0
MKKKGKNKSNGKESLFAHIARCADCGSGMHFKPDRRKGAYVCGGYVKHTPLIVLHTLLVKVSYSI